MAVCLGGGGAFGLGFHLGVASGMREHGIDLARWPMLGTSAGSHAAAALAGGLAFEHVAELWERYIEAQTQRYGVSASDLAEPIHGRTSATGVHAVAARLPWLRREVLSSDRYRMADIVAASSAVVVITRPHEIDGRRYVDGGTVSIASVDLAPAADLLLVLTPFAARGQGVAGAVGRWQARREIRRWTTEHGGDVLQVVATPAMASLGGGLPHQLGDMSIGRDAYPMAIELGHHVGSLLAAERPHLRDDLDPGPEEARAGRIG